jgi:hypothetical protein
MKYQQPYGVSDPDAPYINGNPATGTMGSIPPAASIEHPQREIANLIAHAGLTPIDTDLHQLAKSVQSGKVIYGIDSGPVNNLAIGLDPPLLFYVGGMMIWVMVNLSNTGGATLAINGLAPKNIVRRGGGLLEAGDLLGGYMALLTYNAVHQNWELYGTNYAQAPGQPILKANSNLFVNSTTGDDTLYDGTTAAVAAPHGPFKTIGRAMTETFKYGPSVYTMTINIAAGTYPEYVRTPSIVGPTVVLNGAGKGITYIIGQATPSGYTIHATNGNTMKVQNCTLRTSNSIAGTSVCVATTFGILTVDNCALGSAPNGYILDGLGGTVLCGSVDMEAGISALTVLTSFSGGALILAGSAAGRSVITHLGPCSCSVYAAASSIAHISTPAPGPDAPLFVNGGYVTGMKFQTALNGVINTQGQSINYFPGSIAGQNGTGGQYN